ncbi:MAG: anaerobic ribonucleoside-triphosphate reductase [Methermicoccaceae archaeon]
MRTRGSKRRRHSSMNNSKSGVQTTLWGEHVPQLPKVRTTDGYMLDWDREKIVQGILRESMLSEQFYGTPPIDEELAREVAREAEKRILWMNLRFLSGPLVREVVNTVLLEMGHSEYRDVLTRVGMPVYDAHMIDVGDGFEARENANLQENAETSHKKKADKISKEQYLLCLPRHISDSHLSGDIHIHDLEYFGTRPFCQDWDLRYFFYYGLVPDGSGTKASVAGPAKKPEVAILHAVKALGSAQTNFAGGQGFYNFLTFLAPYLEGLSYEQIEQLMQMFVYEMTQMMVARGGQMVFSSVQLSPGVPTLWRDIPVVYKGKVHDGIQAPLRTYGEFEREVRLGFLALMNVMLQGDAMGKPFNFPKPEISIEPDFMHEDEAFNSAHLELPTYGDLYDKAFELAVKFGSPYFDNQLPAYRGAGKGISCYQCCAYQFSKNAETDDEFDEKMHFVDGKHFSMGAMQVVSVNCPRAAYRARGDDDALFAHLKRMMDKAMDVFYIKRAWMREIMERGRASFATQRPIDPNTGRRGEMAVDIDGLVYTIGVVGINEMVQHHTGYQLHESKDAFKLAVRAMTEMEFYARELSREHGMELALARTPAETTVQRFAVSDLLLDEYREHALRVVKGDVRYALNHLWETRDLPVYYTNGTHVAYDADVPLAERIRIEHVFFPIVDGGDIMHIFLGEKMPSIQGLKEFAMRLAKNTQTGYFAFTKDMTICMREQEEPPKKRALPEAEQGVPAV